MFCHSAGTSDLISQESHAHYEKVFVILFGNRYPMGMSRLSHLNTRGEASMVDVSAKPVVMRGAVARGENHRPAEALARINSQQIAKDNVLATGRLAGILAAKTTGELFPLCHPLPLTHCEVNFTFPRPKDRIVIAATAKVAAQTGVEMEALTAVSVATPTIYDMCKAVDREMPITSIRLLSKTKLWLEN